MKGHSHNRIKDMEKDDLYMRRKKQLFNKIKKAVLRKKRGGFYERCSFGRRLRHKVISLDPCQQ
ncbi:hypothetical protein ES702_01175 [subsurface metagenome]